MTRLDPLPDDGLTDTGEGGITLLTTIVPDVPPAVALGMSVTVMVMLPALLSVAVKLLVPLVTAASAGSNAVVSVLVKCKIPVYPATALLLASSAVTVNWNGAPACAVEGADTEKCVVAGDCVTVNGCPAMMMVPMSAPAVPFAATV
jgi:hypothetical protein